MEEKEEAVNVEELGRIRTLDSESPWLSFVSYGVT